MSENEFPISHLFELGRLSQAGSEVFIAPSPEDLARIARWADVEAVSSLNAKIDLRKLSPTRYVFDALLIADIVQGCVVTLEPLRSHIERNFARELVLTPSSQRAEKEIAVEVSPLDDDGREEIASLRYDLAVPVLEELALAIDPYPRAPGVAFEPPAGQADSPNRPFEALKGLKRPS